MWINSVHGSKDSVDSDYEIPNVHKTDVLEKGQDR